MTVRRWLPSVAVAVAVGVGALVELRQSLVFGVPFVFGAGGLAGLLFVMCLGTAVGVARWAPEVALAAAWSAGILQVVGGVPILVTEASLLYVLFAAARWGRPGTVVVAGLSALFTPVVALVWVGVAGVGRGFAGDLVFRVIGAATDGARDSRLLLLGLATVGIPYLSGLTLRFFGRAQAAQEARTTAEQEARQAQEIARLQEAQNRLARDVHDVVGHSLTVILAQAESAQYLDDLDRLKQTMQTIATSARTSLQDVRQVLTPGQPTSTVRPGNLDSLIESVRASGHPVESTEVGVARPLPPELDTVAYRVLQELLTNAIKHGRRDQPVSVERRWPSPDDAAGALTIVVRNYVDSAGEAAGGGQGLVGIQRRLEAVGGRFEVHRREEPSGEVFLAMALVPVRWRSTEDRA